MSFSNASEDSILGKWKLVAVEQNGQSKKIDSSVLVVFSEEGDIKKVTGNTSKNFFSGLFNVKKKKKIEIQGFMATRLKEDETTEKFLKWFEKAEAFKVEDDVLKISVENEEASLEFHKSN